MHTHECEIAGRRRGWRSSWALGVAFSLLAAVTSCAPARVMTLGLPESASASELEEARRLSGLALDHWIAQEARLQRISQQLRVAGRDLCGAEVNPVLGLMLSGRRVVPGFLRAAAELRFPDELMRVVEVFPGMAAEAAGVKVGDVVLSVAGRGARSAADVYRMPLGAGPLALRVLRDGKELELWIPAAPGCAYTSQLAVREVVNAAARPSERITFFTSAILRALDSDAQLAFVVGHELGHIIIGRVARRLGGVKTDEARADYIGAYLAVRAGYPLDPEDVRVFDVLSLGDLNAIERSSRSHPVTSERTFALRETLVEIDQKRRRGAALVPSERYPLAR